MTAVEEFTKILEKEREDEIIPFLKTLDKKQKKELAPDLKKLNKHYSGYENVPGSNSYTARWTAPKRHILNAASFVCFNQKDFEQSESYGIINKKNLSEILPWYCPDWFNDYADNLA